nr:MAG TPA: hypothetical protein [Caudoviricetes sp.]
MSLKMSLKMSKKMSKKNNPHQEKLFSFSRWGLFHFNSTRLIALYAVLISLSTVFVEMFSSIAIW